MEEHQVQVTQLLRAGTAGAQELLPLVYAELHRIAQQRMGRERKGHTLQATALVSEAFLRLVGTTEMEWRDRRHFYMAASQAMRRVLIDHARKAKSEKRGGGRERVTLGIPEDGTEFDPETLLALDEALARLELEDERAAVVTRLRFFTGLSLEEIGLALDLSSRTVHREWTYARARLREFLGED